AIILLNAVRRPICDPVSGSAWLLLLPAPTAWLSATLGALARCLFHRTRNAVIAVIAVVAATGISTALAAYFGPVAFGLDHFAGYIIGFARRDIPITSGLVSFRASTIAWGVAAVTIVGAVWSADPAARRMHRSWAVGLTLALSVISVGWGDALGWRTSDRALRRELAGEQRVGNVVLHYSRRTPDRAIDAMVRDVDYTATQVEQALGVKPTAPVHVWVYATALQKARLVGGGGTDFAKPFRREIHVAAIYEGSSLRHELIHAFASEFAPWPWRAAGGIIPNVALIEGLAMAYDIDDEQLTLFQDAKAMRDLKIAPDLTQLMSITGFEGQATSRAYNYSGAFVRYLGQQYGTPAVRNLYQTGDFAPLGNLTTIIRDFERVLDSIPPDVNARSSSARRHSNPAVTRRTCAREIYAMTDSAYALAANRLWNASLSQFDEACAMQPENPDLLSGKLGVAIRMQPALIDTIQSVANALFAHPMLDPTLEALTRVQLGDVYLRLNDLVSAKREYVAGSAIPAGPDTRRSVAVRMLALGDSVRLAAVKLYFNIDGFAAQNVFRLIDLEQLHPRDALIQYLLGRQFDDRAADEQAVRRFAAADRLGLLNEDLARENLRLLAMALATRHRCDDAQEATERLLAAGGSRANLATAADGVNRCRFAVARGWKPL
ncbi:MAG: hypothetical protein ABIR92_05795, partial [Gemmatimonadaceae bacterium]